ncbi:hypothetical protein V8C26DRAFT_413220 [Trichoderma gracile]
MMQADKQKRKMCRGRSRIKRWIDGMQHRTGNMESGRVGKWLFRLLSSSALLQGLLLLLLLLKKKKKKREKMGGKASHAWTWKFPGILRLLIVNCGKKNVSLLTFLFSLLLCIPGVCRYTSTPICWTRVPLMCVSSLMECSVYSCSCMEFQRPHLSCLPHIYGIYFFYVAYNILLVLLLQD